MWSRMPISGGIARLAEEIRSPEAWLITTVTRLSIDRLRQAKTETRNLRRPVAARAADDGRSASRGRLH